MINAKWQRNFLLAKEYYEKYGNLLIPKDYEIVVDGKIIKLGDWINHERQEYRKNKLTDEQIKLLNTINMAWNKFEYVWYFKYELAKQYYKEHRDLLVNEKYVVNVNGKIIRLGKWIKNQRKLYKENKLSEKQVKLLEDIDMAWNCNDYQWNRFYLLAKAYYEKHGNLLVPSDYEVTLNGKKMKLGLWIANQRKAYKGVGTCRLTGHQIKLLDEIHMVWNVINKLSNQTDENWFLMYDLAKDYYEKHGNLLVPKNYTVTIEGKEYNLSLWVKAQRKRFNNPNLSGEDKNKVELLNKIGMVWDVLLYIKTSYSNKWYENYLLAKAYYEKHGNLLIPSTYKVEYNGKIVNLGYWISTQRRAYRLKYDGLDHSDIDTHVINEEQIRLLEDIDMVWDAKKYKNITKFIDEEYIKYENGLLDDSSINQMLKEGYFVYSDDNKIVKGDSLVLSRTFKR